MNLIDIHSHLNSADYDADREEVVKRTVEAGCGVINIGTSIQTSREVVGLTQHPDFWATVGIHPHHISETTDADWMELKSLAQHERVVAIGECGLDYFRIEGDEAKVKEAQRLGFERQIKLAQEVGKPLMLHIRDSYDDVLAVLKKYPGARGNAHFFAGSLEQAKQFLDLGFTLSFTGVITFARNYDEVIRFVPLDRIMAETDAPYVAPTPYRGKRNEPLHVSEVVKKIAELKGLGVEECQKALLNNARQAFGLLL